MIEQLRLLADSNLTQIHAMARDLDLATEVRFYAQVLSFYMSGDTERLNEVYEQSENLLKFTDPKIKNDLIEMAHLRLCLRQQNLNLKYLEKYNSLAFVDVLEAEKHFVLARAYEFLVDDHKAKEHSLKAAAIYKRKKCPKKSLRSFYNSVVADSRIYPYKNFVSEYQAMIEMSRAVDDLSFAGMSLIMLSREYQIVELLDKAQQSVDEGLRLLESERGSMHFYNGLLQKSHLLIQTKNITEASKLVRECSMASFPEIKSGCKFLECLIDPLQIWNPEDEKSLLPTWKERLSEIFNQRHPNTASATHLEQKLLKILWSGPVAKWDLIAKIYPQEKNSELTENRFKNLVARVRKKFPGILHFHDGKYFVEGKPSLIEDLI
ncbi:MAG: hypothetical protein V4654_13310 [Bdellovibrionota bacterium]